MRDEIWALCAEFLGLGVQSGCRTLVFLFPLLQSNQEFHEDLFPDCAGMLPATAAQAWWAGDNQQVSGSQEESHGWQYLGLGTALAQLLNALGRGQGMHGRGVELYTSCTFCQKLRRFSGGRAVTS